MQGIFARVTTIQTTTLHNVEGNQMAQADTSYAGDVTDVRLISTLVEPGPYKRLWQPFIARWANDHLIVAYGAELHGKVDMGDIVCSISTDGGDTWGEPVMIFDHRVALGPVRVATLVPVY